MWKTTIYWALSMWWNSSTLATSCVAMTHWKRLWCQEGLGARGEGDDRGWDGWVASLTRWMWVWVNSGSWWGTGRPGMLQFLGSQRVGHDWATELNWTSMWWTSLVAQMVKNLPAMWETWVQSWVGKIPWRRQWLATPVFLPGEFLAQMSYSPWSCRVRHDWATNTLVKCVRLLYMAFHSLFLLS